MAWMLISLPTDTAYLHIVLQVVVGCLTTTKKISSVEGIVHVPSNTRSCPWNVPHTKLLALQQACMEIAKPEHYSAELALLGTTFKNFFVEVVPRTDQVRLQPLRGLVG